MQKITRQRGSRPGRHHVGIPGHIISECPGDFVGIRKLSKPSKTMMRRVGHRPAWQTRCRSLAHAIVIWRAATPDRTITTRREPLARKTQAQPTPSPLRLPQAKRPNTHSDPGTATASPHAGSFPAGFRTPAPGFYGIVPEGRHPEPSTEADILSTDRKGYPADRLCSLIQSITRS